MQLFRNIKWRFGLQFLSKREQDMPISSPVWVGKMAIGAGILYQLTFWVGFYLFRDSPHRQNGYIIFASVIVSLIFVLGVSFIKRNDPFSIFHILRHFSKEAWAIVGIAMVLVLILYADAKCRASVLPYSFDCILKSF